MWFKADGFVDRVRQWWSSYCFQGSPCFILAQKLKALKANLKSWDEQVFRNLKSHKKLFWKSCVLLIGWKKIKRWLLKGSCGKAWLLVSWRKLLYWRLVGEKSLGFFG
jgi:hypothetical protein